MEDRGLVGAGALVVQEGEVDDGRGQGEAGDEGAGEAHGGGMGERRRSIMNLTGGDSKVG